MINKILHLCIWHMKFMKFVTGFEYFPRAKARDISNLVTHFINSICQKFTRIKILYAIYKIVYINCQETHQSDQKVGK
jgi:GH35 family endo-1,4-beta-xylanase